MRVIDFAVLDAPNLLRFWQGACHLHHAALHQLVFILFTTLINTQSSVEVDTYIDRLKTLLKNALKEHIYF